MTKNKKEKPSVKLKKKILHVNQHVIRANKKNCEADPVITVKSGKSNDYVHEAEILEPLTGEVLAKIIYSPDKPLSCGAQVWVETYKTVNLIKDKKLIKKLL